MAHEDLPMYVYDTECRSNKYIAVEDVINIYDESIWWFYIPGHNGYELSNTWLIRSMKHFNKFPLGMLIRPKTNKKGEVGPDPKFEMTNNNNERVTVRLSYIVQLAKTNPYAVFGYPRQTIWTDPASRNLRCTLKRAIPTYPQLQEEVQGPLFTVIDEAKPDDKFKIRMKEDVVVPLVGIGINYGKHYGRYPNLETIYK